MTKNPFLNAIAALIYIIIVALIMFYGTQFAGPDKSVIAPIAVLSLFTFSAAMMGYFFLFQPAQLFLEEKKKQAIDLFLKTLLTFGGVTIIALALLFSGIFR